MLWGLHPPPPSARQADLPRPTNRVQHESTTANLGWFVFQVSDSCTLRQGIEETLPSPPHAVNLIQQRFDAPS